MRLPLRCASILVPTLCLRAQLTMSITADQAAQALGVPSSLLAELRQKKLHATHGDTWAHSIVSIQAPWNGTEKPLDEALQWCRNTYGYERGWTLRLSDGSKLSNVRRYDSTKMAALTPPGPAADEPSLKVKWGDGSVTAPMHVDAPRTDCE